jgi:hypothetical protein
VREGSLREVPTYYPLEKSSRFVQGSTTEEIAAQISECCRIMSVQGNFDHGTATAHLITSESVEIQVTLWHGTAPQHPDCVVVEAQRRRGDAVCFHKYCRHLLDAASGTFDPATFRRCEEREAVLYQKSEELLSRGAKGGAAGKGEAAAAPKVAGADHESALLALEIAASLLKKDRMDARQLGMESLCLLTDPTRSGRPSSPSSSSGGWGRTGASARTLTRTPTRRAGQDRATLTRSATTTGCTT